MGRYIIRRLVLSIPVLFLVTIIIFTLIEIAPGDMVDYFLTDEALAYMDEADIQAMRVRFGVDGTPVSRYINWLGQISRGDLGFSFVESHPVGALLFRRLGNSLILMSTAMVFAIVAGISLGIYTALKQYSIADFVLTGLSFVMISAPAFIFGIILLYVFAVQLRWLPAGGMRTPGVREFTDVVRHLVLPSLTLGLMHASRFMRFQRFSLLEVMNQDYVQTAEAKGLKPNVIVNRHALRNALIPVITIIGMTITQFVAGAIFVETVFSWPGIGTLYYRAIVSRDYPIIMAANLVIAVMVLLVNLITDIAYAVADPRVRYD